MSDAEYNRQVREAIRAGDVDRMVAMLTPIKDTLNDDSPFGTWLHIAAKIGDLDAVKRLVEMGADINKPGGTFEAGPLKLAVTYGRIDIVTYLLSIGVKFDLSEPFKNPLFGAIYNNHLHIVKALVEHGIDAKVKYTGKTMKNMDALAYARELGRKDIVDYLARVR